jgi:uncharacterized protein (TIGR03435 family)
MVARTAPNKSNAGCQVICMTGRIAYRLLKRKWPKQELSGELGRVVIGKTGIPGRFDVALKWMPGTGAPLTNDGTNGSVDSGPSIFTATQEQLGLKLESSEGRCRFSSSIIGRRHQKIRGAMGRWGDMTEPGDEK